MGINFTNDWRWRHLNLVEFFCQFGFIWTISQRLVHISIGVDVKVFCEHVFLWHKKLIGDVFAQFAFLHPVVHHHARNNKRA